MPAGRLQLLRPALCRRKGLRVAATATMPPPTTVDATKQVVADEAQYVLQTYARPSDIVFVRGEGSKLYDASGREFLDMAAGVCVDP
jgi:4-aminobutyrate aminotransferase-like enzyme